MLTPRERSISGNAPLSFRTKAGNIKSLKQYGKCVQSNLPLGYTELDGVTNNAFTRLNTGIIPTIDDVEFELRVIPSEGSWYIFQSRILNEIAIYGISGSVAGKTISFGWNGNSLLQSNIFRDTSHTYYIKATAKNGNATLYVKDETTNTEDTTTTTYTYTSSPNSEIFLWGNSSENYVSSGNKIFFARLKVGGSVVLDYIPAKYGNDVGFYDRVSGTFKEVLDGSLIAGSVVVVPSPSHPVDIVCNNGVLKVSPNLAPLKTLGYSVSNIDVANGAFDVLVLESNASSVLSSTLQNLCPSAKPGDTLYLHYETQQSPIIYIGVYDSGIRWDNNTVVTVTETMLSTQVRIGDGNNTELRTFNITNFYIGKTPFSSFMQYSEIYTDGTVETINVYGKNLFDKDSAKMGVMINANTGTESVSSSNRYSSDYIIVKPNTVYSCNGFDDTSGVYGIAYYDKNKVFVSGESYGPSIVNNKNITVPNNSSIKYIRFCSYAITSIDDCMFVESNALPVKYVPYFNGGTATAEMLLKVGDYRDVQSIIDGAVTRNVGVKVLDGTEDWISSGIDTVVISNATYDWGAVAGLGGFCTHLTVLKSGETTFVGSCRFARDFNVYEYKTAVGVNDITAFKQYLADQYAAGTPVIVVYPIAEPTAKAVTPQSLRTSSGNNTIAVDSNVDPVEIEVKYRN